MAVDRGGLNYRIRVKDEFSRTTRRFRDELAKATKSFESFSRVGARQQNNAAAATRTQTAEIRRQIAAQQLLAVSERRAAASATQRDKIRAQGARDLRRQEQLRAATQRSADRASAESSRRRTESQNEEIRQLRRLISEQSKRERATARIAKQQRSDSERNTANLQREEQQRLRAFAANQKRAEAEAVRIGRSQRADALRRRDAEALTRSQTLRGRALTALRGQIERTNQSSGQLLFTFRRLVGVLALFQLARGAFNIFTDSISGGIAFRDTIESTRIGVGALISAVAEVRDVTGETVDQARELALAQEIAAGQTRLLRQDALATTATFEQLLDTFQVAVAPGLTSGLDLAEVRQFTVQISQAASALGLAQNQLAEEIRSILSGTIQARTTRIAVALGITNEDIRRLREAGNLFEFLSERFQAFAEAGQQAARQTVQGIFNLIRGALREVLGEAAQPLFDNLLQSLNQLFDQVITIRDSLGNLRPNPRLVEALRPIFDVISRGLDQIRGLASSLGFEGTLQLAEAFAFVLETAFTFIITVATIALNIFTSIASVLEEIGIALGVSGTETGRFLGSTLAWLFALRQVSGIVITIGVSLLKLGLRFPTLTRGALRLAGVFAVIGLAVNALIRSFTGIDLSFGDTFAVIRLSGIEAFERVIAFGRLAFKGFANDLAQILTNPLGFFATQLRRVIGLAAGGAAVLAALGVISEEERVGFEQSVSDLDRFLKEQSDAGGFLVFSQEDIRAARGELDKAETESQKRFDQFEAQRRARDARADGDFDLEAAFLGTLGEAERLNAALDQIPGIISTAGAEVAKLGAAMGQLALDAEVSANELGRAVSTSDATGAARQVSDIFNRQQTANEKTTLELDRQLVLITSAIGALREQATLGDLTVQQQGQLRSLLTDQEQLRQAGLVLDEQGIILASRRAAISLSRQLPQIERETALLQAQVSAQMALVTATIARVSNATLARIEAENALEVERVTAAQKIGQLRTDIDILSTREAQFAVGSQERGVIVSTIAALRQRLAAEEGITDAKRMQLEFDLRQAEATEGGGFLEGIREGLVLLSQELPTAFEVGLEAARASLQGLSTFLANELLIAFDGIFGGDTGNFQERLGQFLRGLAQTILSGIIDTLIGAALQRIFTQQLAQRAEKEQDALRERTLLLQRRTIATQESATVLKQGPAFGVLAGAATTLAGITIPLNTFAKTLAGAAVALGGISIPLREAADRLFAAATILLAANIIGAGSGAGVASGGAITRGMGGLPSLAHMSSGARAYAGGGDVRGFHSRTRRPAGIPASDTVPAWLTPGEFVFSRPAVQSLGMPFIKGLHDMATGGPRVSRGVRRRDVGGLDGVPFQTGGPVEGVDAAANVLDVASGGGGGGGVAAAALVQDEETADTLFAGPGFDERLFRFFEENGDTIFGLRQ